MVDYDIQLREDEEFLLKERAKDENMKDFTKALSDYFTKKYKEEIGRVKVEFNEISRDFLISCDKGSKTAEYPESISLCVMEFRKA